MTLHEFQNWLRLHANKSSAYCCVCKCEINVLTMGISAVRSHERGMKQKEYWCCDENEDGCIY